MKCLRKLHTDIRPTLHYRHGYYRVRQDKFRLPRVRNVRTERLEMLEAGSEVGTSSEAGSSDAASVEAASAAGAGCGVRRSSAVLIAVVVVVVVVAASIAAAFTVRSKHRHCVALYTTSSHHRI